jgi:hypothetical protein
MVDFLATFIAMVVILITAFDQPFTGSLRVGPDSFRLILDTIAAR